MLEGEPKEPHYVDIHVGLAVRNRRRSLGMTQPELAARIGISFQQIQRYETGFVRISASKLYEIAHALETSVCFFFLGLDDKTNRAFAEEMDLRARALMTSSEGIELAELFPNIEDANVRQHVVDLVRALQAATVNPA